MTLGSSVSVVRVGPCSIRFFTAPLRLAMLTPGGTSAVGSAGARSVSVTLYCLELVETSSVVASSLAVKERRQLPTDVFIPKLGDCLCNQANTDHSRFRACAFSTLS